VKKKKAYSMIELIMAVGSLLLVLGVFSVIVKTYLWEFSEGTLGERKWADVQTFFTYVNLDLENTYLGLVDNGTSINIITTSPDSISIAGVNSDNEVYSKGYSFDSSDNGTISRDGAVVLRGNDNFSIQGMGMSVYTKSIGSKISEKWSENYVTTGNSVTISSDDGSNYYVEPVIKLSDGSQIKGGYALRFDNVTTTELETDWTVETTEYNLSNDGKITISNTGYDGEARSLTLTAEYDANDNKINSITYDTTEIDTEESNVNPAIYDFGNQIIGDTMVFIFDMDNSRDKDVTITVTLSEPE
jgi:hypothetical protein